MPKKKKSLLLVIILAVASAIAIGLFLRSPLYYPNVAVNINNELTITFLKQGRASMAHCEAAASEIANILQTSCKTCQVVLRECLAELNPQQQLLLSTAPLTVPSATLPDGVVTYTAANMGAALAACTASETAGIRNGVHSVKCYPPNTARAAIAPGYKDASIAGRAQARPDLFILALVLVSSLIAALIARYSSRPNLLDLQFLADLPRSLKRLIMVSADLVLLPSALLAAIALRHAPNIPDLASIGWLFIGLPLLTIPVFAKFGLYRAVIRYFEIEAAWNILWGVTLSTAILATLSVIGNVHTLSRLVFPIYWLTALILIGNSRIIARHLLRKLTQQPGNIGTPIAIFGAGKAGVQLARNLRMGNDYSPVAFFDDDPQLVGTTLGATRVFALEELTDVVDKLQVKQVFLAAPSVTRRRRQELFAAMEQLNLTVKTIPSLSELLSGKARIEDIREISIEELLSRDPVVPDERLLTVCNRGKSVMITGAGGSIGSELCRQVLQLAPTRVVLYEISEIALYQIEQELEAIAAGLPHRVELIAVLGSVCDPQKLAAVIRIYGVQTLYHAAAYKHVPIVERNVIDGLRNNTLGTWTTAEAAQAAGVENFILISTDKAVRPTNVMGASKRFAELVLQGLASQGGKTRFCMVRFGNVLGSSGSVVPRFERQINAGGPVTVTHPEVTRYFMTVVEAAQLVIQAGALGSHGDVFLLDMGVPVKILQLATRMIHLSGRTVRTQEHPAGDIEITFTGLRPGEKLYEELLISGEVTGTPHSLIMRSEENCLAWPEVLRRLGMLEQACTDSDYARIYRLLEETIEGYTAAMQRFDWLDEAGHTDARREHPHSPPVIDASSRRIH